MLLSSSHFLRFARFGMTDAPLTFFMVLAFYFFLAGQVQKSLSDFLGNFHRPGRDDQEFCGAAYFSRDLGLLLAVQSS